LTEKLLLFGRVIQLAGEVKARGDGRARIGWGRARAWHLGLLSDDEI
jgi:hypothetical protein